MQDQNIINDFFKQNGTTEFPKEFQVNGKCHIGNIKGCRFYEVKDGIETCKRGWCYTR